jgi:4-amino-4-deoxy-L-arabinose transferase-like glycosyltransferase
MGGFSCRDLQSTFIINTMRELLRKNPRYFLYLTLAALLFRLYFALYLPVVSGDSYVYANLAKTLLNHHVYGLSGDNGFFSASLIRLPGYPYFLAAVFKIFGPDNWPAVMVIHAFLDTITCLIVAAIAWRVINERAAKIAFLLAAFCPFTANYAGTGLTETPTFFFTALTLLFAVKGFQENRLSSWVGCGVSLAAAILLRPDAGWLLGAVGLTILIRMWVIPGERRFLFRAGLVVMLISLLPLVPWTIRNWRVFHVFQPLVNPHAVDPSEWEPENFSRWVGTWLIDYSSMEDFAFKVSGETVSINDIPERAFSDAQEKAQVAKLIDEYNDQTDITRQMDEEFGRIADRHIREHPIRYYFVTPFLRLTCMWLRPRTEMLPFDTHWWAFDEDLHDSLWSVGLMLLNFAYIAVAMIGILRGPPMRYIGLFILYLLVRSAFLMYMGAAEQRYTLEGFPCLWILGARYLAGLKLGRQVAPSQKESAVTA